MLDEMCFFLWRTLQLHVQSVVPSLEGSEPLIALLHLRDQYVESWLQLNPLYCRGEQRALMRVKHSERTFTLLCPCKRGTTGNYEIFLGEGKEPLFRPQRQGS